MTASRLAQLVSQFRQMRGVRLVACSLLLAAAVAQGAGLPPFLGAGGSLTAHPKGCAAGTVWYRCGVRPK